MKFLPVANCDTLYSTRSETYGKCREPSEKRILFVFDFSVELHCGPHTHTQTLSHLPTHTTWTSLLHVYRNTLGLKCHNGEMFAGANQTSVKVLFFSAFYPFVLMYAIMSFTVCLTAVTLPLLSE